MTEYNLLKSIDACNTILKDSASTLHLKIGTRLRKRLLKRKLNRIKQGTI